MTRGFLSTAVAVAFGTLVLLGYFIQGLTGLRLVLVHWAIILAGVAVFVGVFNLLSVHWTRVRSGRKGLYSLLLIVSLLGVLLVGLVFGPQSGPVLLVFEAVIVPVEAALMALLAVTLLIAGLRMLGRRSNLISIVFFLTALLMLLGAAPLVVGEIPVLNYLLRPWIAKVPAMAGGRGILIGVALGTLTTGLRILLGADRPYGGR
jgi:hypothetical protein